jgi:type IV pilus assembly protein PilE
MITVVVVGILASIAVPAYTDYVRKSRRADGKTALTRIQLQQEKWRAGHMTYSDSLASLKVGTSSPDGHYTLTLSGASESGYTATAAGGTKQQSDKAGATSCKDLTLTVSGNDATYGPAECWK